MVSEEMPPLIFHTSRSFSNRGFCMKVLPKYRLELRWKDVEYKTDDVAHLKGAFFTGPVLKHAAQINPEDHLLLDLTKQHVIFPPMADYYHAFLDWKGVEYKENKVYLKEAWVRGKYVNTLEKLSKDDWILIDCKGHDTEDYAPKKGKRVAPGVHMQKYNHLLVYYAEVQKKEEERKY